MRICRKCQGQFNNENIDDELNICETCMGYDIANENLNMILPILNEYGMEYRKQTWGNGEGISLFLGKGIFLNFANAGGVFLEFDSEVEDEEL